MTQLIDTSPTPRVLDALTDRLSRRPNLQGVGVSSGPRGHDFDEGIEFLDVDEDEEYKTTGRRKHIDLTISGSAWTYAAGNEEQDIRASRTRAFALVAEIERELRETEAGVRIEHDDGEFTVKEARMKSKNYRPLVDERGRVSVIVFTITAWTELTRRD